MDTTTLPTLAARRRRSYPLDMLIGIMSDSHDDAAYMARGLELLQASGCEFFCHCGDIGSQYCIDLLAGLPSAFVFGNCDWNRAPLARYAETIGVACCGSFASLQMDGKRVAIIHGDDFRLKQKLIDAQEHDYLLQGHTHIKDDRRVGAMRIINPGALHRATIKTVATLDLSSDVVSFHVVNPTTR